MAYIKKKYKYTNTQIKAKYVNITTQTLQVTSSLLAANAKLTDLKNEY